MRRSLRPRRCGRTQQGQRGSVTVWTVVLLPACFALVGLVLDGGTILRARSSTFDLAAGAARAGAQQLDRPVLETGTVTIDPDRARHAVDVYLDAHGVTGTTQVAGTHVTVTVHTTVHLQILRPATVALVQTATATAVESGGP